MFLSDSSIIGGDTTYFILLILINLVRHIAAPYGEWRGRTGYIVGIIYI